MLLTGLGARNQSTCVHYDLPSTYMLADPNGQQPQQRGWEIPGLEPPPSEGSTNINGIQLTLMC